MKKMNIFSKLAFVAISVAVIASCGSSKQSQNDMMMMQMMQMMMQNQQGQQRQGQYQDYQDQYNSQKSSLGEEVAKSPAQIAAEDPRIFYGGMLLNQEIVEKEQEATLLVNPRPTGEEYVKYSFPSKTMEYMASGTPVLTTVLPGMPKEYHPYVYLLEDETSDGITEKLKEVFRGTF